MNLHLLLYLRTFMIQHTPCHKLFNVVLQSNLTPPLFLTQNNKIVDSLRASAPQSPFKPTLVDGKLSALGMWNYLNIVMQWSWVGVCWYWSVIQHGNRPLVLNSSILIKFPTQISPSCLAGKYLSKPCIFTVNHSADGLLVSLNPILSLININIWPSVSLGLLDQLPFLYKL